MLIVFETKRWYYEIQKIKGQPVWEIFMTEHSGQMLIPFYIFSYEKNFPEYNGNEQKLEELKAAYQKILERLCRLEQPGVIGAFDKRTIIDLSGHVIKEIARKYENVQKGIGNMMSGALIETSARTILNQGITQNQRETALRMLKRGKMTMEEIAEDTALSIAEVIVM